jgi:protein-tyrosine phosphatase
MDAHDVHTAMSQEAPSSKSIRAREQRLLFLCTGNYYRSRFAEEYWNARAEEERLSWRADSRALGDVPNPGNAGTMSADALAELARLGIRVRAAERPPRALAREELALYVRVFALDGDEHRPMLLRSFPAEVQRVECWDIGDVWKEEPKRALARLVVRLEEVLRGIRALEGK